ncbi:hypothetical protein LDENG_00213440 [Lucifuga dentata]|nr:hypothetical protein LDENG_00213440 [Lucifuga dentata]
MELELPENENLHPPLSITVVDWRAFGRSTLVGNHIINNLKALSYAPLPDLPTATHTPSAGATPTHEPQSTEELSQHAGETSTTVVLTKQDVLITVEEETPSPALPTPKPESKQDSRRKSYRHSTKRRRRTIADESAESVIDWWSKYYASVEKLQRAKRTETNLFPQIFDPASPFHSLLSDGVNSLVSSQSDGEKKKKKKGKGGPEQSLTIPTKLATLQLYNKELEAELGPFDDWVNTFELYRGKANEDEGANEERFVGKFKVRHIHTHAHIDAPMCFSTGLAWLSCSLSVV